MLEFQVLKTGPAPAGHSVNKCSRSIHSIQCCAPRRIQERLTGSYQSRYQYHLCLMPDAEEMRAQEAATSTQKSS